MRLCSAVMSVNGALSIKCCTVLLSTIIAASITPAGIYSALLYNRVSYTSIGAKLMRNNDTTGDRRRI